MFNDDVNIYTDLDSKCPTILVNKTICYIIVMPEYYNNINVSTDRFILRIIRRIKTKYFYDDTHKDIIFFLLQFINNDIQREFYHLFYIYE
jgi:hypothetical protein